jgi:hypothetical protein
MHSSTFLKADLTAVSRPPNHGLQGDGGTAVVHYLLVHAHVRGGFRPRR